MRDTEQRRKEREYRVKNGEKTVWRGEREERGRKEKRRRSRKENKKETREGEDKGRRWRKIQEEVGVKRKKKVLMILT